MAVGRPIKLTPNVARKTVSIIATADQTTFTPTGGYRIGDLAVYRNGVRLVNGRDYTAVDGANVILQSGASLDDVLEFGIFDSFNVADAIGANGNQSMGGDLTVGLTTLYSGTTGIVSTTYFYGDGSNLTGVANTGDEMPKTSANNIMDFTADFTWDVCSYNPHAVTGNQNIVASVSRSGSANPAWYIYNYQGSARWDSADQGFYNRLTGGEQAMTSNYVEDTWCVSRLQREGSVVRSNWFYAQGTTWTVQGSVATKTGVSGTGPKANQSGGSDYHGQMYLGGWGQANNTTYSLTNIGIAWMAFFAGDGTISGEPYKNEYI